MYHTALFTVCRILYGPRSGHFDITEVEERSVCIVTRGAVGAHVWESTSTPKGKHASLGKRRKMGPLKSVIWTFYTSMQSLNKMTFTEAALRRNGKTYFLSEKDPEPGPTI